MRRLTGTACAKVCSIGVAVLIFTAGRQAFAQTDQDEANSRGVRIIAAPTPSPPSSRPEQPLPSGADRPYGPYWRLPSPPIFTPAPAEANSDKLAPPIPELAPNKPSITGAPTERPLPGSAGTTPASSSATSPSPAQAKSENPTQPPTLVPSAAKLAPNKSPAPALQLKSSYREQRVPRRRHHLQLLRLRPSLPSRARLSLHSWCHR